MLLDAKDITAADRPATEEIFLNSIFPVLTPLAIDPAHPFPFIPNLGFSLALKLRRLSDGKQLYALVPVPTQVDRFWELPPGGRRKHARRFFALESFLILFLDQLFPGCEVEGQGLFRLIRNCDVEIEEEAEDLVREFEARLKRRRLGSVVRVKSRRPPCPTTCASSSWRGSRPSRRTWCGSTASLDWRSSRS